MTKSILDELDAILGTIGFPGGFADDYIQLECLAHGHGTETFLVRKKDGGALCVAKCYDRAVYRDVRESAILQTLSHSRLPGFIGEYRDENTVCVVREYVEGTPLDQYAAGCRLSPSAAVSLLIKLCDILTYLHGLKPPVIHRDIKPQNVIVQKDGGVALIDFDIARTYEQDADTDTHFIGTRAYAPPEQYGFSQTDGRTDIYALGVLLCFMLTGHTDVNSAAVGNRKLAAVMRRCTAFAPGQRYPAAVALKKALWHADRQTFRKPLRACAACACALALLGAGFAAGRYIDRPAPAAAVQSVQFAEPLIERAVRKQLGLPDSEPLTGEALQSVRGIYIFGNEVSASDKAFLEGLSGPLGEQPRGGIASLADAALLPNLEVLYINYQSLNDIAPLAPLQNLRHISLRHTYVSDLSPLADMRELETVALYDTNVKDLTPLSHCLHIDWLELGRTPFGGIGDIPDLPLLTQLSLQHVHLNTLAGIERFPRLEQFCLTGTDIRDLTPLKSLSRLVQVRADESMRAAVEALGDIRFTVVYE